MKFTIIFLLAVFLAVPAARAQSTTYGCILNVTFDDPGVIGIRSGRGRPEFVKFSVPRATGEVAAHSAAELSAKKCTERGRNNGNKSYSCSVARCFDCAVTTNIIAGVISGQRKACAGQ